MPRPAKGARLWLRPARRRKDGTISHASSWIILDGGKQYPTGCGLEDRRGAEQALAAHIAGKYEAPRRDRDLSAVPIPDVIAIYLRDCAERQVNRKKLAERARRLLTWWGTKSLADVTMLTCRAYIEHRKAEYLRRYYEAEARRTRPPKPDGGVAGARRDLEDLRAAIQHHAKEGLHRGEVRVHLPERGAARERWLTRDEAAALLWACWRTREKQKRSHKGLPGEALPTAKYTMRHLARFILIGLYTGTRAGAIASASWAAASGRSYIDLDRGVFYRLAQGARATKKRQPPAPIPARLLAHLRRWKETGVSKEYPVEYRGQPIKSVKVAMARAVELAGLEPGVTPHTLRHTAVTWLMQSGVTIWDAASFVGMSPALVERTYGHHHPDYMARAAHALSVGANKTPMKPVNRTRTGAGETV